MVDYGTDYNSNGEITAGGDLSLVDGVENAKQSIKNQLLTEIGTYPSMDTDYGSRIYEIIGEDINQDTLATLEVIIRNALYSNPRVANILEVIPTVTVDKRVLVNLKLELIDDEEEDILLEV